jgi:oxygen-independent coproporphyrinogen-3 oxidase
MRRTRNFSRDSSAANFPRTKKGKPVFLEVAMTMLERADYEHYEISNYARPGFRSEHNQAYWRGADYLGLGPSAFSTRSFERWQNVAIITNTRAACLPTNRRSRP